MCLTPTCTRACHSGASEAGCRQGCQRTPAWVRCLGWTCGAQRSTIVMGLRLGKQGKQALVGARHEPAAGQAKPECWHQIPEPTQHHLPIWCCGFAPSLPATHPCTIPTRPLHPYRLLSPSRLLVQHSEAVALVHGLACSAASAAFLPCCSSSSGSTTPPSVTMNR